MPAQWTAEIIGEMHLNGITKKQLAASMGVTPEYLSMVLNGHRNPVGAEQKARAAIDRIIERKNAGLSPSGDAVAPLRHAPHDTSPQGEASQ